MLSGIKEFHAFIQGPFTKEIRESYEGLQILSEGDLQAQAWFLIRQFFQEHDPTRKKFKVLNKPYFKDLGIHPDIAVFKRAKPWVLFEVKERKRMTEKAAQKEWLRLLYSKKHLHPHPKRGYLVYVARYGCGRILRGRKGAGARYFFELPITLEQFWKNERIVEWEKRFKKWSKYIAPKRLARFNRSSAASPWPE